VTILDDMSTGGFENVRHLQGNALFRMVVGSVCDRPLVEELVKTHERVFHLAAAVGVRLVIERPVSTIETNVSGTETVLRYSARYARPVLVTSTSEVYGKSSDYPFREDGDCVLGPSSRRRWAYACSKLVDEFLALARRIETGLPVVVARLFNTVGPRQTGRYGMVIPTFVRQALAGEPLTVYGDGEQRRCFCDVADVAPALVSLMECEAARGEVVNLGSTEPVTMNGLARLVLEVTGSASEIVHVPYEEAYPEGFEDMPERRPDISKAERLVGFRPATDLRATIARIVEGMCREGHER
jgi:UDP-glucose 4-epimerase